jgi:D-alanyl-D-alanine carboxypeptidase (penicillin-binding protein 5/6)
VAGESPDKSEQRKSSGETTPGERDPRLAVFRQASPGTTAPPVDQPTAVFKTMPPETSDPAGTPGWPEPGTASGSVENDTRLRAAVAAWVASADDGGADEGADEGADAGGGDASAGAEPAAASGADAASGDDASADDRADDVEMAAASQDMQADVASGPATAEDHGDDGSREAGDRAGKASGDAASAGDWVGDAGPAAASGADVVSDRAAAEGVDDDRSGDDAPADPVDGRGADAPAGDRADDAARAAASEAERADAGLEAAEGRSDVPSRDAGDQAGKASREDASAGDPADAASAGDPADAASGRAASWGAADSERGPAEAKDDEDDQDTGSGSAEAKDEDAPSAPPSAKRGVDQPTTVFKAPRPPVADQPTTALKVPPVPKPKPAADAGRTSTFVPLRGDGVRTPDTRQPEAAAPKAAPPATPASLTEAERTKQQPMPPLPPLDLLAELTNTPPPPQTPVRTVIRRIKIWTPLVVLLLIVFAIAQAVRPLPAAALSLSPTSTYTFEGGRLSLPWPDEGQGAAEVEGVGSLGTYGAQKPAPIASVAKTMTAYVILKEHPIKGAEVGPKITVDKKAEEESKLPDESTAPIQEGQQFTERQMLQLLMIPSGNNAARLLARWDAKSEAEFVKKMNDAAKDLGMTNTTYTDPSGLKATTVSTPQDQLKLAKAVMQNDVFRKIVDTTLATIPGVDGQIRNNNDKALLQNGVGGIKTGSSTPAGGNLLWSANTIVDGEVRRIVGIVMGIQKADTLNGKLEKAIDHSIEVIEAAQEVVISATVIKKGEVVGYVDDGLGGQTPLVATKDLKAVGWAGLKVDIELADGGKAVPHAAKAGTVVGQVSVGSGTGKVTAPVALQQDLVEPGFGDKLTRLG